MNILQNIGLISICLLLLYILKKIFDCLSERTDCQADGRVYKAAGEFARGASSEDIASILDNCIDLDEKDAEEILSRALSHRGDVDGGYGAFLKAVNEALGEDVYGGPRRAS